MTGPERVAAAFDHREPDRVPWFEQAFASDVASALLGRPACTGCTMLHYEEAAAWMRGDEAHDAFVAKLYDDTIALARALEWDMLCPPWRFPTRPAAQLDEYTFVYGDPEGDHDIYAYHPVAKTFYRRSSHRRTPPSDNPDDLEPWIDSLERGLETATVPRLNEEDWQLRLQRDVGAEFMIPCGMGLAIPYEPLWLVACALRPDLVRRYLEVMAEHNCLAAEAWAARGFTVVWGGGDMADNHGPFFGPRVFHEVVLPPLQRWMDKLHALGMRYVYRTDGNLWPVADDFFVHSRIDGFGEIDHDAGMRIPELQARYGERITFWGDVPCGSLLHRGTAEQVREFVLRRMEECRGSGGWILGSSNSVVPGTPVENAMAMYEALRAG
ncbi:MAG: hypothetical protein HYU66_27555 [Armatimonadetes bacterium]|nr:hypothetical protein [Armatimonadota bacterium]